MQKDRKKEDTIRKSQERKNDSKNGVRKARKHYVPTVAPDTVVSEIHSPKRIYPKRER